jgi:cathepsin F
MYVEMLHLRSLRSDLTCSSVGTCNSCWSFSAAQAIEGAYQIAGNPLTEFSEQQLVSCDYGQGTSDQGCGYGGYPYKAMDFVKTHPLCTEADYPYTEVAGGNVSSCKDPCVGAVTLTGVVKVPSESAMLPALEQQVGLIKLMT